MAAQAPSQSIPRPEKLQDRDAEAADLPQPAAKEDDDDAVLLLNLNSRGRDFSHTNCRLGLADWRVETGAR